MLPDCGGENIIIQSVHILCFEVIWKIASHCYGDNPQILRDCVFKYILNKYASLYSNSESRHPCYLLSLRQPKGLLLHRGSADNVPAVVHEQIQCDQIWVLLQHGSRLGVPVWALSTARYPAVQKDVPTRTWLHHRWQRWAAMSGNI